MTPSVCVINLATKVALRRLSLPLYAAVIRSTWSGVGAVDNIIAVRDDEQALENCEEVADANLEGEYGALWIDTVPIAPSKAIVALLSGQGATIDVECDRVLVGDECRVCPAGEVAHYKSHGMRVRPMTRDEHRYMTALSLYITGWMHGAPGFDTLNNC